MTLSGAGNVSTDRKLVFYDDARARAFEPFALSRPFCEMRVGALLVRERWEYALRATTLGFVGARHLESFTEGDAATSVSGTIPAGTVFVNARAAIALSDGALVWMRKEDKNAEAKLRAWFVDGRLAAFELRHELEVSALSDGRSALEDIAASDNAKTQGLFGHPLVERPDDRLTHGRVDVKGYWMEEVWDVVRHLTPMLAADIPVLANGLNCSIFANRAPYPPHLEPVQAQVGEHKVFVEKGATIEPFVMFDTSGGPILLRAGSTVQSFTRVVGPCYVGRDSMLMGEKISGSSIGDTCRVHGELSSTVFLGFANKGHDGFVGHSIVGRWVNMGAGTITSNLKNTYGTVALWTPQGVRDTGMQFLGTLFGDHAKTGIGLKLTTGCVLGMGANVFDRMPPKVVEPFAWGSGAPYDSYDVVKFADTAARMMSRRHVELSDEGRRAIAASHAARWDAS